jgi:hypothetical protein
VVVLVVEFQLKVKMHLYLALEPQFSYRLVIASSAPSISGELLTGGNKSLKFWKSNSN